MPKWKPVTLENIGEGIDLEGLVGIEVFDETDSVETNTKISKNKLSKVESPKDSKGKPSKEKAKNDKKIKNKRKSEVKLLEGSEKKKLKLELDQDDKSYLEEMVNWKKHGLRNEILKALHDQG